METQTKKRKAYEVVLPGRRTFKKFAKRQASNLYNKYGYLRVKERASDTMIMPNANTTAYWQWNCYSGSNYLSSNGGAYGGNLTDWTSFSSIYDLYKVTGIKFTWIPGGNSQDLSDAQNATNTSFKPMYLCLDPDSGAPGAITTEAAMIEYEDMKVFDYSQRFDCYFKIPKTMLSGGLEGGWLDIASPPTTNGSITMLTPPTSTSSFANANLGKMIVTYYIKYRTRR